jgi:hypothetical protein
MLIEPDKAEPTGQIRIDLFEFMERAKRLHAVNELCEHATVSVVDKKDLHSSWSLLAAPVLTGKPAQTA